MADTEIAGKNKSGLKWGIAVAVLAAGYADLARGGVTLAPILLVVGYAVLIPVAIVS